MKPAEPAVHQRERHSAAGKETSAIRASSRSSGSWPPVTAARARATVVDSREASAASGDAERTTDRCVATRW